MALLVTVPVLLMLGGGGAIVTNLTMWAPEPVTACIVMQHKRHLHFECHGKDKAVKWTMDGVNTA